jgi:hypothetical protein
MIHVGMPQKQLVFLIEEIPGKFDPMAFQHGDSLLQVIEILKPYLFHEFAQLIVNWSVRRAVPAAADQSNLSIYLQMGSKSRIE